MTREKSANGTGLASIAVDLKVNLKHRIGDDRLLQSPKL